MNAQEKAFRGMFRSLLITCGVNVKIVRSGETAFEFLAVAARCSYDDSDKSNGISFANWIDVLVETEEGYTPTAGDVVVMGDADAAQNFVVRPVARELWRFDDVYKSVVRFHAQRRSE